MRTGCAVCRHHKRAEIDGAHLRGVSIRDLAVLYDFNKDTINKHVRLHLRKADEQSRKRAEMREAGRGDGTLAELADLAHDARRIQAAAERKGNLAAAIAAVRELARQIEPNARIIGEIQDKQITVQAVVIAPETAERMARAYLPRRGGSIDSGYQTVAFVCSVMSPGTARA